MRRLRFAIAALVSGALWALQERTALAAEGGGDIDFGDVGVTIATVAIFLLLLLVLRRFAWKPILAQLQKREQAIADSLAGAAEREKQAQELLASYRSRLDNIEAEARQILSQSRAEGLQAREKLLAEARDEARKLADEQRRDIERSKQDALRELYERTAQLASEMAGQVLLRRLSSDDQRKIMSASLDDIGGKGGRELMERISRPWPSVMDAADYPLAEVYAGAVLANLPADAEAEAAVVELNDLVRLLKETPMLDYVLFRAPISVASRCGLVEKVFLGRCSAVTDGLLGVLTRRDRLPLLPVIVARFRALLDRRQGKVDVTVTTAVEMDEPTRQRVIETMAKKLGAAPALHAVVDPGLVGGMVVSVAGRVYDDSIQTELERMRDKLAASIGQEEVLGDRP